MKYRPYWRRILFLAVMLNAVLWLVGAKFLEVEEVPPPEDLLEIEWYEPAETVAVETTPEVAAEIFPEVVMPPLEIPHTVFEPLPELPTQPPPEIPPEVQPEEIPREEIQSAEKPSDPADKLKVIVKVYPKDIIPQLVQSGIAEENLKLKSGKVILAATITVEGKVREVEIVSGGDNGLIDLVAKNAAGGWIFEPYLDAEGNPQPLRTQIEFTPEDF